MRIGYACINMTLSEKKVSVNRGMVKKTFQSKGLEYVSELIEKNISDFFTIIKWNEEHGINFYRMSSDMFPWMSEYEFNTLPNYEIIKNKLNEIGGFIKKVDHRITFHPGPFNVLASPKDDVVIKTINELRKHAEIMDMLDLPNNPFSKINIHIGGGYNDKKESLNRWCKNYDSLPNNVKSRLTVENDDKSSLYTVKDLMFVHEKTGVPIVFDYHHHFCHNDGTSTKEALLMSMSTWGGGIKPIVHVSEPKDDKNVRSHHDYVMKEINTYDMDFDVMLEAKQKEKAVLKYKEIIK
jgi:UV DNA damage endonuclease